MCNLEKTKRVVDFEDLVVGMKVQNKYGFIGIVEECKDVHNVLVRNNNGESLHCFAKECEEHSLDETLYYIDSIKEEEGKKDNLANFYEERDKALSCLFETKESVNFMQVIHDLNMSFIFSDLISDKTCEDIADIVNKVLVKHNLLDKYQSYLKGKS